jgi:23S rRNA-/tRNA-specific pseudouridylate synthase
MAIVNKPENVSTTDGTISTSPTGLQSKLGFLVQPSTHDPLYHPHPIHRLDRRTSGLVLVAKTRDCVRTMSKAFADRSVVKTYTAVVGGQGGNPLSTSLLQDLERRKDRWTRVDYPIVGKEAVSVSNLSDSESSDDDSFLAMVQLRPKTGRTHPIRRHLS